jgi:hypothetical protein
MAAEISSFLIRLVRGRVYPALLLAASLCAAQAPAGWNTLSPGFSAQMLLSHNHAMWAAGSGETIAVSQDAGQHWVKKHENPNGALLLSFGFASDKFGYAAGTGGVVLFTQDGGENWSAGKLYSETILQAAFGDSLHGVIRTRTALLATINGGKDWIPVVPANYTDWTEKSPYTDSVAALDASHMIVRVSEGQARDGVFLWTADGGATWTANYLPNGAGSGRLFIADGKYWAVGHEVVGKDKPGGGLGVPMAVRSADGVTWDHLPVYSDVCHWHGCGGCTPQGCFAGESSFVPFSRILQSAAGNDSSSISSSAKPESLDRFPAHLLSDQWAISGNTLCVESQGKIECTGLMPVASLDTEEEPFDFDVDSWPPLHPTRGDAMSVSIESALGGRAQCIRCTMSRTYFSDKGASGPTDFELAFAIGASGRAERVQVTGPIAEDVAATIRQAADSWLFERHAGNGSSKPIPVKLSGKVFVMNFAKPPK